MGCLSSEAIKPKQESQDLKVAEEVPKSKPNDREAKSI